MLDNDTKITLRIFENGKQRIYMTIIVRYDMTIIKTRKNIYTRTNHTKIYTQIIVKYYTLMRYISER